MDTYQEWRATIGALMSKLYFPTGYDYHAAYKRYADSMRESEGHKETLMDITAVRKEIEKDLSWIEDSEFTYRRRNIDGLTEVTVYDRKAAVVAGTYVVSVNLHEVTPGQ